MKLLIFTLCFGLLLSFTTVDHYGPPTHGSQGKSEVQGKCISCHSCTVDQTTEFTMNYENSLILVEQNEQKGFTNIPKSSKAPNYKEDILKITGVPVDPGWRTINV